VNESGKYRDATGELAPMLKGLGMVTDAVWSDFDGDNDLDLIVVGEWMAITVLENDHGKLTQLTRQGNGLQHTNGWWMSIVADDMDGDGDDDYILGNMGENYKFKATQEEPFELYTGDFGDNGSVNVVMGYHQNGKVYPAADRNKLIQQNNFLERSIPTYDQFALMTLDDIYGKDVLRRSLNKKIYTMKSGYLENIGYKSFIFHPFSNYAQISCSRAITILDVDGDSNKDVVLAGNLYDMEAETIRLDGGVGALLKGDGKGSFIFVPTWISGLFLEGDVRSVLPVNINGKNIWIYSRNNATATAIGLSD
jgi:hypothetical protein